MNIARRAVRASAYALISSYFNLLLGFVTTILLTRVLSPQAFGAVSLAAFFLSAFDLRGKLGFEFAFTQRQSNDEELLETYLGMQLLFGAATVGLALLALLPLSALGYPDEVRIALVALALISVADAVGSVPRAALEKELQFRQTTVIVSLGLLVSNAAAVGLALGGFGIGSLLAQAGVNALEGLVLFWRSFRRRVVPRVHRDLARWMLGYGSVMFVGSVATLVLLQFDNFLVGSIVGITALGYYERAFKVAQWPTGLVTHVVSRTAFPTYAKLQADPARLSKAFGLTLWLITSLSLPLAIALFVSAPDFILLIFGESWLPTALYLRILIGYSLLRPLMDDTGALFAATGKPQLSVATLSVQAVTLVLCATPLTFAFGAVGTAIGVGCAYTVGVLLAYRNVARHIDISLREVFQRPAIAAVVAFAAYGMVRFGGDFNQWDVPVRLFLKVLISGGTYVLVMLLLDYRLLIERTRYIASMLRAEPGRS